LAEVVGVGQRVAVAKCGAIAATAIGSTAVGLPAVGLPTDQQVAFEGVVRFVDGDGLDRDHQGDGGGDLDVGQHQVDQGVGPALFQGAGRVVAGHGVGQVVDRGPARGGVRCGQGGDPGGQAGDVGGVGVHKSPASGRCPQVQTPFLGGLES
jgi:hypothetical protein